MDTALPTSDSNLIIDVRDTKESFRRTRVPDGPDPVLGKFSFVIDITAVLNDAYVPVSIASGKKPTGFVYQIEGTVPGAIATTHIECKGEGITQVTLGTIVYARIPRGMTATFRIRIEMRGQVGKSYRVVIRQMQYKRDPGDARYIKLAQHLRTKMVKFS